MQYTDQKFIARFLAGKEKDHKGREYDQLIYVSDEEMEKCHDQIQWMFPLHEESHYCSDYPVITTELFDAIQSAGIADRPLIDINLGTALTRMESFYNIQDIPEEIDPEDYEWCTRGNHNLLRITRIIYSLRLLGFREGRIRQFYDKVCIIGSVCGIDDRTLAYWTKAMYLPLWTPLR